MQGSSQALRVLGAVCSVTGHRNALYVHCIAYGVSTAAARPSGYHHDRSTAEKGSPRLAETEPGLGQNQGWNSDVLSPCLFRFLGSFWYKG